MAESFPPKGGRPTAYTQEIADLAKEFLYSMISKHIPLGSGLYPYGWYRLTIDQRRQMWASALDDYFSVKKSTDPNRVINPFGLINGIMPP